ncbi:RDD family protein [Fulvivirga sp. RKSG066]|uniref:RDD family protein n=1 Tax=Fulvivirga aurantia TaxID=2529383 RepID=UPI0012BD47F7|nr:RDD family protein [Fulvivirga aurantia]MTI23280.1 RDD family protein [Fulvivirga aurantia]
MNIKTEAKVLRRGVATIIDYGLYLIFFTWLVVTYGEPNDEGGYTLSNDSKSWWIFIFWVIYFPIIESIRGQTLGKLILGLRVITKTGNAISFGQAFKRHLMDMIDFFFFGLVAIITVKNTPDHQRVGDLLAKTIVVGGESITCANCNESLTLTPTEIMNNKFVCPSCKKTIEM